MICWFEILSCFYIERGERRINSVQRLCVCVCEICIAVKVCNDVMCQTISWIDINLSIVLLLLLLVHTCTLANVDVGQHVLFWLC